MRTLVIITAIAISMVACKKTGNTPEGPADIRIRNLTDQAFEQITVDTSGGENDYEGAEPGEETVYKRFEKAYPIADISVVINGETYSTVTQNYNYQVVLGQGKFTYEVFIENNELRRIAIHRVIPEAPLDSD